MRAYHFLVPLALVACCSLAGANSAEIPIPGEVPTLWLDRSDGPGADLVVSWEGSCGAGATDYAIFEGVVGAWNSHTQVDCSDSGADLIEQVESGSGNRYYLVVPMDSTHEGSYGEMSSGELRPQGVVACRPVQDTTPCESNAGCESSPDPGEDSRIGIVRDYITAQYAPAMAGIAVVHQGSLAATTGIGGANGETMFWIASTSKFVTAVGAVTLMAEGHLDQNNPVTTYVTDYTENNGRQGEILIEHLLQNRSGLPQDGGCAGFACRQDLSGDATTTQYDLMNPNRGATLGNIFTPAMLALEPYSIFNRTSFVPGTNYQYAGWGWMLAGRAMELASSQTFDILMQDRVLDRAGMCRATYDGMTVDSNAALGTGTNAIDGFCLEPMLPPGHQGEGEPYYHDELDCAARMPQGGLHASAHDMGRMAEAVLQDLDGASRITTAAASRKLFCPDGGSGIPGAPGSTCFGRAAVTGAHAVQYGPDYGFGNFRRTYFYRSTTYDLYVHGGGRAGFGSYFAIVPEAGLAVSVLVNNSASATWHDVAECAIRVYLHGATSC
jgi:CubicO group peptidase (beta-lactamase class C family)